jgi:hypothetical protein
MSCLCVLRGLLVLLLLLLQVIDAAFTGSVSRIGGMNLADLQREAESFWAKVRRQLCAARWGMVPLLFSAQCVGLKTASCLLSTAMVWL